MATDSFFELRAGAPGLPGPYLLEHMASYHQLDSLQCPSILMAIGGQSKNRWLRGLGLALQQDNDCTAVLASLGLAKDTLLIDCQLHQQGSDMRRIIGGPQPGNRRQHLLEGAPPHPQQIAYQIYGNILAPFCDVAVLFADDLCMQSAIDLLAVWVHTSTFRSCVTRTRVVFVCRENVSQGGVRDHLLAAVLARLRAADSTADWTHAEARSKIDRCMILAIHDCHRESLIDTVKSALVCTDMDRSVLKLKMSALQIKVLLQASSNHYAGRISDSFDIISASRVGAPIPEHLSQRLTSIMESSTPPNQLCITLVASALVVLTYPKGMPPFPPDKAFTRLYSRSMRDCAEQTGCAYLPNLIEAKFTSLARSTLASNTPPMVNHQRQLYALQGTDQLLERSACSFCLFQDAATELACSHRLCIQCTTYWGSKNEPSYWYVKFCPVCKHQSNTTSNLGLSVAGCRVLRLGGTDPAEIWTFLRQLQRIIGLTSMPFRDQFDKVIATDIGIFFAITIFLEGWDLSDCKHHLPSLKNGSRSIRSLRRNLSSLYQQARGHQKRQLFDDVLSFGPKLSWDVEKLMHSCGASFNPGNGGEVVISRARTSPRTEVCVEFLGGFYSTEYFSLVRHQMVASSLYVELEKLPDFYTVPVVFDMLVKCRVPPGNALIELLWRLQTQNSRIYQASSKDIGVILCTVDVMEEARRGYPLMRIIQVEAMSPDTMIDLRLSTDDGHFPICQLTLRDLGHCQSLDAAFCHPTDRIERVSSSGMRLAMMELEDLKYTLQIS